MSKQAAHLIKTFLERNHITVTRFANEIGISRFSVYKYLKGFPIHKSVAEKIATRIFTDVNNLVD